MGQALFETNNTKRVDFIGGWWLYDFDFLFGQSFDLTQLVALTVCQKDDRFTFTSRATGSADTVDVRFGIVLRVIVENVANAIDVQTARGNVSRNQHIQLARLELINGSLANFLRHVAVQSDRRDPFANQLFGNRDGRVFGFCEHDHAIGFFGFQNTLEHSHFVAWRNKQRSLPNRISSHRLLFNRDLGRFVQILLGDLANRLWQRRREQSNLAFLWCLLQNELDVFFEAHV